MLSLVKRDPEYGWGVNLKDEFDRMFRSFYDDFENRAMGWSPSVDIVEDNDKIILTAEIPGIDKKNVKINLQNSILTIEGEKKRSLEKKKDDYYRSERCYGKFCRTFSLSSEIESDKIKADFKNGILTITMPKSEKVKPRQIEIN